jgi:hypothetical protein
MVELPPHMLAAMDQEQASSNAALDTMVASARRSLAEYSESAARLGVAVGIFNASETGKVSSASLKVLFADAVIRIAKLEEMLKELEERA